MTTTTAPFQIGDRVGFVAVTAWGDDGEAISAGDTEGTVTRAHWGRNGKHVTVRTDDGRTFVRYAEALHHLT